MSSQSDKRWCTSHLLDAQVDKKKIAEIVGVTEQTVNNVQKAKNSIKDISKHKGSGGRTNRGLRPFSQLHRLKSRKPHHINAVSGHSAQH